jgi:hypothetical protein
MKRLTFLASTLVIICFGIVQAQLTFDKSSLKQSAMSNFPSRPLVFTENRGQWDSKALFKAEAGGTIFWFCKDEVIYQFIRDTDELIDNGMPEMPNGMPDKFNHPRYKKESMVIRAEFMGVNQNAVIMGDDRLSHNNNYFIGNIPSKWATDVPNYSSITYKDIYPGIDLKYHGDGKGMKYDFIVNPGADIAQIKIRYYGTENLAISNNGDLEAATRFGDVYEKIPAIYHGIGESKRQVEGRYTMLEAGEFGFAIDDYNPAYPVVIDPELVYSTYLGGIWSDYGWGIAVDQEGCAYVTGEVNSSDFPLLNPYQILEGLPTVAVTKLSLDGNSLIYSTFLGGGDGWGYAIAVDSTGSAYITGGAGYNFPLLNPYRQTGNSFVTKLSPSGNSLIYSTLLGIYTVDGCYSIAVDNANKAYVTGCDRENEDCFVFKFSSSGRTIDYGIYLGGNSVDFGCGIFADSEGSAYVTGWTSSTNFPTRNAYQAHRGGGRDAFVTKLTPSGDSIIFSTYLGGNLIDHGNSITVDASGHAYVTGITQGNFPMVNPFDGVFNGGSTDVFVSKFSVDGDSLLYSTYLGGNGFDGTDYYELKPAVAIDVDSDGRAYIVGKTTSTNFPTYHPFQANREGAYDAFVTIFSPTGDSLEYSTYFGGASDDEGFGIALGPSSISLDAAGSVYITGRTESANFPLANPFDSTLNGAFDVFVAKISTSTGLNDDNRHIPSEFILLQNYPNPFNAQTMIRYDLPAASDVTLDIFDILGRRIETLVNNMQAAGHYEIIWNPENRATGVYFCRMKTGDSVKTQKMLLVR